MLSKLSSCGISLVILLCCLSINDAVPHGPHPTSEVRGAASSQSQASDSTPKKSPITGRPQLVMKTTHSTPDFVRKSNNANRPNTNFNRNVNVHTNVNSIHARPLKPAGHNHRVHKKQPIKRKIETESQNDELLKKNDTGIPDRSVPEPKTQKVAVEKEETTEKCVNEARRQNQTYTRSFPQNISSINLAEEFKIAGEADAKKSSSVHVGEDIALCWIETTTIKEDPSFEPPKRLVIREFTISFENSATIPENYLECDKLEGEIAPGDSDTVGKTSFNEMIDENTKRSRVVNFTSVHRIGPIIVTQHKTVRCGVGAVVSKDIYEWPDATDNPKKRVEIKVGPSICDLGAGSHEQSGECATDDIPKNSKVDQSSSASSECPFGESCENSAACKEGEDCNKPRSHTSCVGDDCVTDSLPETTYPPDSNDLLPTGVTRRTATKIPEEGLVDNDALPSARKSDKPTNDSCVEGDADCLSRKIVDKSETVTDQPKQSGDGPEGITGNGGDESCQGSAENCSCSGESCSIHDSGEPTSLETGNKRTDLTNSSVKTPSEVLDKPRRKTSKPTPAPLMDSECELGGCSSPSGDSSDETIPPATVATPGKNSSGIVEPAGSDDPSITLKNTDDTTELIGETELAKSVGVTEGTRPSKIISNNESVPLLGRSHLPGEKPKQINGNSSTTKDSESPVTEENVAENSRSLINKNENSPSCDNSTDENCKLTISNGDTDVATESDRNNTIPKEKEFEDGPRLATSEAPDVVTNSLNGTSSISSTAGEGASIIEPTTIWPKSQNSSRLNEKSTECSPDSESSDCTDVTTSSSLGEGETILPSNPENPPRSPKQILNSTEANKITSTDSTTSSKKSDQSTCDESTESCEFSTSDSGSEACEDGSSGSSCSSELNNSAGEIVDSVITTTEPGTNGLGKSSTTIDNISTTVETRRSTISNVLLTPPPVKGRRRLALRIKVLLEHINENKEKEKLVQVEKQLLLNENPDEHGNHSLLWQIKSLNDSMNVETLKAIFNCSAFEEIAENMNNLTESGRQEKGNPSVDKGSVKSSLLELKEDHHNLKYSQRKKRQIPIPQLDVVQRKNITDARATAIRESLPGVEEDFKKGLGHVMSRISKELETPKNSGVGKVAESSSSSILKLLASPTDPRIHSRRRRKANKVGGVMFVEEPKNLVKGEEIDRWSNERLVNAADGGKVRTVTEFKLLRDAVGESSRRLSSST